LIGTAFAVPFFVGKVGVVIGIINPSSYNQDALRTHDEVFAPPPGMKVKAQKEKSPTHKCPQGQSPNKRDAEGDYSKMISHEP
jgi:hypothetical protein